MKKRIQLPHPVASGTGAGSFPGTRTGDHCPANGWWAPLGNESGAQFITEGSIMPAVSGRPISWKLVLQVGREPSYECPPRGFALDSL